MEQVPVAAGGFLHPFVGVDEQQRRLRIGGCGDHVFEKLLVSRRIDDHVLSLPCVEPDLRRVDGDVLVPLRLQGIHQIGPLERHAAALGGLLELLQFAFGERAGVVH